MAFVPYDLSTWMDEAAFAVMVLRLRWDRACGLTWTKFWRAGRCRGRGALSGSLCAGVTEPKRPLGTPSLPLSLYVMAQVCRVCLTHP